MRYSFKLDSPIVGFAAKAAGKGASVPVMVASPPAGLLSSEDGAELLVLLESISHVILHRSPQPLSESQIDRFFVIMDRAGNVDVYVNEPQLLEETRVRQAAQKDQHITRDMIVDIVALHPEGLTIEDDKGFIVMLSSGWHRSLLFDVRPLQPQPTIEQRNFPQILGAMHAYLMFQSRFTLTEDEWTKLIALGWFPFAGLPDSLVCEIIAHLRNGWSVDDLLPKIAGYLRDHLGRIRESFGSMKRFERHATLLLEALDLFEAGKYAGATHILFARAEGLMREHYKVASGGDPVPLKARKVLALVDQMTSASHEFSLLMPSRFREYLDAAVFGFEDFSDPEAVCGLTRHSIMHGLAPAQLFNEKSAVIGILIVLQLSYLVTSGRPANPPSTALSSRPAPMP